LAVHGGGSRYDIEPDNSSQTISAFSDEGSANAGAKEGSLTSAYRVENTTLVRNGDDMLRSKYGAESEVLEMEGDLRFLRTSVITKYRQIERSSY
jgi:hypothetical protein